MAITLIADTYVPNIWVRGAREKMATFPSILNSGIARKTAEFDAIASGAGISVAMPFWKDISDQLDEPQVENQAPTIQGIPTGIQIAPILNRVIAHEVSALACQVSGENIVDEFIYAMVATRMKNLDAVLISELRGAFGSAGANGAAGALSGVRLDSFDETGLDATSDQMFSPDLFIRSKGLMGELADTLQGGAMLIHPNVLAGLELADVGSFMPGLISGQAWSIRNYRQLPIFVSERLARPGTGNGFVYDTYIFAKGVVAWGEKPQVAGTTAAPVLDVASINYIIDAKLNNEEVIDRTRRIIALNGMKWVGTPAGQSASNAELATPGNWEYVGTSQTRAGIVCVRTNG